MKWTPFAIIAAMMIIAQTTLADRLAVFQIRPDWMIVLVVFYALYAVRRDACMGAWILGMLVDLSSIEPLGIHAFAFTTIAMIVNSVRHLVFLKNPMTHFFITLIAVATVHGLIVSSHALTPQPWHGVHMETIIEIGSLAIYSAAWAIPTHDILLKFSTLLGLATSRYAHPGLSAGRARSHS